jgi:hypothetical protein
MQKQKECRSRFQLWDRENTKVEKITYYRDCRIRRRPFVNTGDLQGLGDGETIRCGNWHMSDQQFERLLADLDEGRVIRLVAAERTTELFDDNPSGRAYTSLIWLVGPPKDHA